MNLIDRYVTEVGKHLPRKNRLDIETELRSTLEDMLEDRSQQTGRPADEALATELLQEYGAPSKVAATYQTHPYLIGPRMFPTYTLVLKIVLFAVTLGLTIATVVSLISSNMTSPEALKALGEFAASLVSALMAAFGNVTLVFAILERVLPNPNLRRKKNGARRTDQRACARPRQHERDDLQYRLHRRRVDHFQLLSTDRWYLEYRKRGMDPNRRSVGSLLPLPAVDQPERHPDDCTGYLAAAPGYLERRHSLDAYRPADCWHRHRRRHAARTIPAEFQCQRHERRTWKRAHENLQFHYPSDPDHCDRGQRYRNRERCSAPGTPEQIRFSF